ncbi:monosaccharide ABC transporter substrate-binding protein, CUT2 family [Pseudovibrio ascidiaceicola]|uniref:Monosaccharide ABC transporter substrate-binding protein, CUT2 family n=1 Tax=Pseudovibrio ascidiaceicola TaxID=285279 RepID=A0A1I3Y230_9HYPH|nr:TMAO reductase system periplasmic protein TorT [Pseudovibrio ascidiaceicola]SFK25894.1 monosaccharide ABC transporter substrate-binding protein, CUT2 family [Pseudovibrio ascidiaceicola]
MAALVGISLTGYAHAETWTAVTWEKLLDFSSSRKNVSYEPLTKSRKAWRLCALYPHLKDSYWLSVNYGMVKQAEKLDISLRVYEAGGYYQLGQQQKQLQACADSKPDAILLGTVSFEGHYDLLEEISRKTPVIALVNNIRSDFISAATGVDWDEMGSRTAQVITQRHPAGTVPVNVSWFPGAGKPGISSTKLSAFKSELKKSSANLLNTRYGDTGKLTQLSLIEDELESETTPAYLIGTGVSAEAAIGALKVRGLSDEIEVVSGYLTHGVFRGIKRGKIIASPTDQPVLQGMMAIDQSIRLLEGKPYLKHFAPEIQLVTKGNIAEIDLECSLSPASFSPTYMVDAKRNEENKSN